MHFAQILPKEELQEGLRSLGKAVMTGGLYPYKWVNKGKALCRVQLHSDFDTVDVIMRHVVLDETFEFSLSFDAVILASMFGGVEGLQTCVISEVLKKCDGIKLAIEDDEFVNSRMAMAEMIHGGDVTIAPEGTFPMPKVTGDN